MRKLSGLIVVIDKEATASYQAIRPTVGGHQPNSSLSRRDEVVVVIVVVIAYDYAVIFIIIINVFIANVSVIINTTSYTNNE